MAALLIRLKVTDYDLWRRVFDEEAGTRRANGALGGRLFRSAVDPGELWVLLEWDDLHRAQLFARSDDLIDELIRAEVTVHPDIWYLEEIQTPDSRGVILHGHQLR